MVHLQFMVASALLKNTVSIEEWFAVTPYLNRPAIKYSNLQGKKVFLKHSSLDHSLSYELLFR